MGRAHQSCRVGRAHQRVRTSQSNGEQPSEPRPSGSGTSIAAQHRADRKESTRNGRMGVPPFQGWSRDDTDPEVLRAARNLNHPSADVPSHSPPSQRSNAQWVAFLNHEVFSEHVWAQVSIRSTQLRFLATWTMCAAGSHWWLVHQCPRRRADVRSA